MFYQHGTPPLIQSHSDVNMESITKKTGKGEFVLTCGKDTLRMADSRVFFSTLSKRGRTTSWVSIPNRIKNIILYDEFLSDCILHCPVNALVFKSWLKHTRMSYVCAVTWHEKAYSTRQRFQWCSCIKIILDNQYLSVHPIRQGVTPDHCMGLSKGTKDTTSGRLGLFTLLFPESGLIARGQKGTSHRLWSNESCDRSRLWASQHNKLHLRVGK